MQAHIKAIEAVWPLLSQDKQQQLLACILSAAADDLRPEVLWLTDCGPNKIQVIKELRNFLELTLVDAKNLADKADNAPVEVAKAISGQGADKLKWLANALRKAGATVEFRTA